MGPVRTLLVDDNARFLAAARRLLATQADVEIVGHALSGRDALAAVDTLRPELVLMDLVMPEMNGLEATAAIKRGPNPPRVVIVTLEDSEEHRERARVVGADAVVGKATLTTTLSPLLREMFPK
jgi:DNA-binding NarL/FixJ family response regulator